jgi:hypothetical protein
VARQLPAQGVVEVLKEIREIRCGWSERFQTRLRALWAPAITQASLGPVATVCVVKQQFGMAQRRDNASFGTNHRVHDGQEFVHASDIVGALLEKNGVPAP